MYFSLAALEFLLDGTQPDMPATYHKTAITKLLNLIEMEAK